MLGNGILTEVDPKLKFTHKHAHHIYMYTLATTHSDLVLINTLVKGVHDNVNASVTREINDRLQSLGKNVLH